MGAAIAVALAAEGWQTVVVGRRAEPLDRLVAEHADLPLESATADIADADQVQALFDGVVQRHGRLSLLVNNAGRGGSSALVDEADVDEWRAVVDTNVTGTFLCTRAAFGAMRKQDPQGGRILNNGSLSAHVPRPRSVAYTTTKHAITGLTKATALDGRPFGITCGQFDIGNAATEMTEGMAAGVLQADGSTRPEPTMDPADVARLVVTMAAMPAGTAVLNATVMAAGMPYVGRG